MKDTTTVLVQCVLHSCLTTYLPDQQTSRLKDVSDPKQFTSDGQTVRARMKLCGGVAEDIKRCANVCDTYVGVHRISTYLILTSGVRKRL